MRSQTKVPIAGLDRISAGMAIVLAVLFFGAAGESASAATGRPYLETVPTTGEGPGALTADAAGNLYLGNIVGGAGVVEKIDAAGNPIDFTASAPYISANRLMYGSGDIAVSKTNGFIYLSRGEEAPVFAPSGASLGGVPVGQYNCGVGVDPSNGDLYRSGLEDPIIPRYEVVGTNPADNVLTGRLRILPEYNGGCNTEVDSTGAIYISTGEGQLVKFTQAEFSPPTGPLVTGAPGTVFTNLNRRASAVTVEPSSDNVFADAYERGYEYGPGGALLAEYPALGNSNGAVFSGGKLFVSQTVGGIAVFGGLTQLPIARSEAADDFLPDEVTLHGEVDPDSAGNVTGCEFRYGIDQRYTGGSVPCDAALPITGATAVEAQLGGLDPATTYHFQLAIENGNGVQLGADQTFTTPPAVEGVATGDATEVSKETATLHGSFVGRGEDIHYYFEYGTTSSFGQTVPAPPGIDAGSSSGQKDVAVPVSDLQGGTEYHYRLVGTSVYGKSIGEERTFTTAPAVTNLVAEPVTGITNHSVELNGSFDADSYEVHYYYEWGATTTYGKTVPIPPGGAIPPGSGQTDLPAATISGLQEGGTYHFRVVASNARGVTYSADASFITAELPSVGNLNTRNVLATSVELTGEVDPNLNPTSYYFEWGPTNTYGNRSPIPDGSVGAGGSAIPVSVALDGLSPGLTYHFRLVAANAYGTDVSADQSFSFHPADCPNAQVRQETRSNALPDCRAYELVSPQFAQGTDIYPERGPAATFATSPSRLAYGGSYGTFSEDTGNPSNVLGDLYVSTRTATGWYQKFIGKPAEEAFMNGGPPGNLVENFAQPETGQFRSVGVQATPDLSRVISYDLGWPSNNFGQQSKSVSNAPYVWDTSDDHLVERWPTNLSEVTDGEKFVGWPQASADASHFVFQSNLIFAPGGTEVARQVACCSFYYVEWPAASIYDNDLKTGEVSLASIKGDDTTTFEGFVFNVSEDGSRILMSEERASPSNRYTVVEFINDVHGPLYLRADGEHTYEIAPGRQIAYVGSSGDGKTVYLRSAEQLTPDDHDSSTDLFVWHESDEELTRVSVGDAGEIGNSDSCGVSWSGGGCNVEPIERNKPWPEGIDRSALGNTYSDNPIATANGDIYFISPEQLLEGRGQQGMANLYLYRDGSLRFVAALNEEAGSVFRMQVSPDGEHMAFLTRARVTAYDNAGHLEMYMYSPHSGRVTCTSCRPDGQPPTSDIQGSKNGLFQAYDGRTFFATDEALVARDTDKVQDIYEYTEGRAQLISAGIGSVFAGFDFGAPSGFVGVSANGVDVYFATVDSLVTQDHNGASLKIYDARTGGGFPAERTPEKCSAADECHGPGAGPPVLPPDRTGARLSGNATKKPQKVKKRHGKRAHKKKGKRKRGRARNHG